MELVKVKIKCKALPEYGTELSSGADLRANIENPILLQSLCRATIPTGVSIELPDGYEAQVRCRSGLASKHGVVAMIGTIDNDYRGEIGVTLINISNEPYRIMPNDKIAQLVLARVEQAEWEQVDELGETERGTKGFGSTGR